MSDHQPPERKEPHSTLNDVQLSVWRHQPLSVDATSEEDHTANSPSDMNSPINPNDAQRRDRFILGEEIDHDDGRKPDTTVRRKLRGIQLFMITINGTLGTGLYVRSGQILELGGPVAVIMSFVLIGILAWAVMQCITELLCIWPVPGALPLFVGQFVDRELGVAVGIVYWFGYSVIFGALISASAGTLNYWISDANWKGFRIGMVYVAIPILLCFINAVEVGIYGWFEVFTGVVKMMFLFSIIVSLIVIQSRPGSSKTATDSNYTDDLKYDHDAASGWFTALMMSLSIATFAYSEIEIIAASVIEARWAARSNISPWRRMLPWSAGARNATLHTSTSRESLQHEHTTQKSVRSITKLSAVFVPVIVTAAYTVSGLMVSLNLKHDDERLPRLSWKSGTTTDSGSTSSPFVMVAEDAKIEGLDNAFNAFILLTALTCANTNLYVASRTLFGLGRNAGCIAEWIQWFGKTNRNRVPIRAMVFSALAFGWVPFLQLAGNETAMSRLVEILGQMGSVSVLIVWTCQCLAYIRNQTLTTKRIQEHDEVLQRAGINLGQSRNNENSTQYLHRSHWQPLLAYLALVGCLFVLVVCNGAFLWKEFHYIPFCSSYLTVILFLGLWVILKLRRRASFAWVDLNAEALKKIIASLDQLRIGSFESPPDEVRTGGEQPLWTLLRRVFGQRRDSGGD